MGRGAGFSRHTPVFSFFRGRCIPSHPMGQPWIVPFFSIHLPWGEVTNVPGPLVLVWDGRCLPIPLVEVGNLLSIPGERTESTRLNLPWRMRIGNEKTTRDPHTSILLGTKAKATHHQPRFKGTIPITSWLGSWKPYMCVQRRTNETKERENEPSHRSPKRRTWRRRPGTTQEGCNTTTTEGWRCMRSTNQVKKKNNATHVIHLRRTKGRRKESEQQRGARAISNTENLACPKKRSSTLATNE